MRSTGLGVALLGLMCVFGCSSSSSKSSPASGTKTCTSDSECSGMDCEHVNGIDTGACVKHCSSDANCGAGYVCLVGDSIGLEASCFRTCNGGGCAANYSCAQLSNVASNACLPTAWGG